MRKIILFSLLCASSHLMAQKSFFGVNGGVNVANQRNSSSLVSSSATYYSNSFGFNAVKPSFGLFYQRAFSEDFAIRLNAQYMGMGSNAKGTQAQNLEINYLTLPLTVHYSIDKRLSFNTGVYLSFTLGGTRINNQPITNTYHKNDRGISFGSEYEIHKNIAVGINYIVGLMNVWLADTTTDPILNTTQHTKITNRALQFTLIYKFKKLSKS